MNKNDAEKALNIATNHMKEVVSTTIVKGVASGQLKFDRKELPTFLAIIKQSLEQGQAEVTKAFLRELEASEKKELAKPTTSISTKKK